MVNSFNHFRALAIIFIVAGHSLSLFRDMAASELGLIFKNLVFGGTILFVFISGFLYHHVFYKKTSYFDFMIKKIQNVFFPYLFFSFFPIAFYIYLSKDINSGFYLPNGLGFFNQYVVPYFKYLLTGRFLTAYWFIPFVILLFSLSPIYDLFIKLDIRKKAFYLILLFFVSILMHRPIGNINTLQSYIYFIPVYLFGITCSIYRDFIYDKLQGKELFVLFVVLVISSFQVFTGHVGSYHKAPLVFTTIDLMFIQKIFMCLFFMVLFHRYEDYNNKLIDLIAATSFSVYFIHPFFIVLLGKLDALTGFQSGYFFVIFVSALMFICVAIAFIVKYCIPKYSRFLTGF